MSFLYLFQIPEITPPPSDDNGFKVWSVGVLVLTVASLFALWRQSNKRLIESYDKRIAEIQSSYDKRVEELQSRLDESIKNRIALEGQIGPTLAQLVEQNKEIRKLLVK